MNKKVVFVVLLLILSSGIVGYWLGENLNSDSVKPYYEIWLDSDITVMQASNLTTSLDWRELDLSPHVPPETRIVKLLLNIRIDAIGAESLSALNVQKHGTLPSHSPQIEVDSNALVGVKYREFVEVGVGDDAEIDYAITIGEGWKIDARIMLLGYNITLE